VQERLYDKIGNSHFADLVLAGRRSISIFESIRASGTTKLKGLEIQEGDLIEEPSEWNVSGIYLDLGLKRAPMTRSHELYLGSACSQIMRTSAGKGSLRGIANRVFNQHEYAIWREQHSTSYHYVRGYGETTEDHLYCCLWVASDDQINDILGYTSTPARKTPEWKEWFELVEGFVTLVEAVYIRLLGVHRQGIIDGVSSARGLGVIQLRHQPLNRASALEAGGDRWDSESGRAAGKLSILRNGILWGREMGKPEGESASLGEIERFRKGTGVRSVLNRGLISMFLVHESEGRVYAG
jgi:hypothetical protein